MFDPIEALEEAAQLALGLARDDAHPPQIRINAIAAATRAATALVGARGSVSRQEVEDLMWARRAQERLRRAPAGALSPAEALGLQRAEHILLTYQPKQEMPAW